MSKQKTTLLLVGIPGSGKSTFRNKLVKENGAVYTNRDEIRIKLKSVRGSMKFSAFEDLVYAEEMKQLKELMDQGHELIVVDDTHLSEKNINKVRLIAESKGYEFKIEFMTDSFDVPLCHKRNTGRPHDQHVPAYVIETMAERFAGIWFSYYSKDVVVKKDRQKAIIVDLDGTLAHNNTRGPFEWHRVGEDTVHHEVVDLVKFYKSTGHTIIAVSGRDGVCYPETEKWLLDHKIPFDMLFMRPQGDSRKDVYVKLEIYRDKIMADYNVTVSLDDRLQIVRAFRGIGLRCIQVQSGWF